MRIFEPVHFIFGYVDIRADNGFPERFINMCTAEGVPLWDMRRNGTTIYAKTTPNGFKSIRSPARKSSMRVRLVKKHGLPFVVDRVMCRTGLIAGIAAAVVLLTFLSGRIWIIEADVEDPIAAEAIIEAYEEAGLRIGMSKRADMNRIKINAAESMDNISWTTVNVIGTTATVKVREIKEPENADIGAEPSNIIALKDGQVEIIEAYRGSGTVCEGDTVMKGDMLVSGITEGRNENNIITPADGYVVADTVIKVKNETSACKELLAPQTKRIYSIYFLGKELPLGKPRESECCYEHRAWLYAGGKKMPFGVYYRTYTNFERKKITVSQKENLLTAINDYSLKCYTDTLHTQIKKQDVSIKCDKDTVTICGEYDCYENIGEKVPLTVSDTETGE